MACSEVGKDNKFVFSAVLHVTVIYVVLRLVHTNVQ